jgi:hypothetical protein
LISRNIFDGVRSGYANVTRYTGIGTGNVAWDNIGWESAGVLDVGPGLTDGGGNRFLDPELERGADFHPGNPLAQDYGRYAPGDGA